MNNFSTLADVLLARCTSKNGVNFLNGENVENRLRFADIYSRACGLLNHLQQHGARTGDELVVVVDRNEQFLDAFWAGILGNMIVVPISPGTTDEHRAKFFRIYSRLHKPFLFTDSVILERLRSFAATNEFANSLEKLRTSTVLLDQIVDISKPGTPVTAKPDDIAFVQYSSGSTREPKGVALTHRNLLTNIAAIVDGAQLTENDVTLSWMPLTHDMGLIGFHLTPLFCNAEHYLMPTPLFVRRPQLWITKAAEHHVSILCSPNFGYRHFLKSFHTENQKSLNLSGVRLIFNGAEPISAELCDEFTSALKDLSLNPLSMFPVYGLAEASLAVTFPVPSTGYRTISASRNTLATGAPVEIAAKLDQNTSSYVVVGQPISHCKVRIGDDTGHALPDLTVGHILIKGDNVTRGYYLDNDATQAAVRDGWLDTGDLGFMSADGLVVTGRSKDIIFVHGQNFYPQDIEAIIEKTGAVDAGKIAVCGARRADSPADELLVFVLYRGDDNEFLPIAAGILRTVNEKIGIPVDHVIPVARLPKTTSGKIQRFKLADAYLKNEFSDILEKLQSLAGQTRSPGHGTGGEIERNLKQICDDLLKTGSIGATDNIFELGTSSLTLAQVYERIEAIYPGQLEITDFFDYPTISELAKYLETRINGT